MVWDFRTIPHTIPPYHTRFDSMPNSGTDLVKLEVIAQSCATVSVHAKSHVNKRLTPSGNSKVHGNSYGSEAIYL